jgi:ectoine hydroxylase-related dioxygenase (phytanoyl-CoA dioxygenase family)
LTPVGFKKAGALPVPVKPGDVIFHNILVVHGSASCSSPLRRTVYYEYRAIEQELRKGPHVPEYVPLKQSAFSSEAAGR